MTRARLALSIDVEDWPQSSWDRSLPIGEYCADNTLRMLDILAESPAAKATFFVLGKFADKHPHVVRAIDQAGHEVACHGHGHVEVFDLDRRSFAADIWRSTDTISELINRRPIGYRAPDFSITARSLWVLEVLAEHGYEYDSSIFPVAGGRYGIRDWPRSVRRVRFASGGSIAEVPLATVKGVGRRWPVSGGGYARLLPGPILSRLLRKAARQAGPVTVFYCHPYELDPGEFGRTGLDIPWKVRLHQGLGRGRAAGKLRRLLATFECLTIAQALEDLESIPEMTLPEQPPEPEGSGDIHEQVGVKSVADVLRGLFHTGIRRGPVRARRGACRMGRLPLISLAGEDRRT